MDSEITWNATPRVARRALRSARCFLRALHRAPHTAPNLTRRAARRTPHAAPRRAAKKERRSSFNMLALVKGRRSATEVDEDKAEQGKARAGGGGGDAYPVHGEEGADDEDREREEVGV